MQGIMATRTEVIRDFIKSISGTVHVTFEEGTQAVWLYDLIKPLVAECIVCNAAHNKTVQRSNKTDKIDCHNMADLLRLGSLKAVYHDDGGTRKLKQVVQAYTTLVGDSIRVMNRTKAIYRGRGVPCAGKDVYRADRREEWIAKTADPNVTTRLQLLYLQLDSLNELRRAARKAVLAEASRHRACQLLEQVPSLGNIRAAQIVAIVGSPFRFRTKRQFWPYCGLAVLTHTSSDYEIIQGRVRRNPKSIGTRGLNHNYNRHLKQVFKAAALYAKSREPFKAYYDRLIANHMKPELARLTLARKIAAITLAMWKKGEGFDADRVTPKTPKSV